MANLPESVTLADDGNYQVVSAAFVQLVPIRSADGWVREIKATFTNRPVLRMTLAKPYPDRIELPPAGEFSAGPFRI